MIIILYDLEVDTDSVDLRLNYTLHEVQEVVGDKD